MWSSALISISLLSLTLQYILLDAFSAGTVSFQPLSPVCFLFVLFCAHLIIVQTWNLSIEDQEIKEDPESKQMVCANANPVNLSHKQL